MTHPVPQPMPIHRDGRMWALHDEAEPEARAEGFRGNRVDAYQQAFVEAMCGRGDLWAGDWDVEIAKACAQACALINATDAQRWAYLEGCLSSLAHERAYAKGIAP